MIARWHGVLDAYLSDLEAGRPADPARLLAEHPDLADQLRACLHVMQWPASWPVSARRRDRFGSGDRIHVAIAEAEPADDPGPGAGRAAPRPAPRAGR